MAQPAFSSGFTVTVNGNPLSDLHLQQLVSGVVDDSLNVPDLVVLRFRDPDRMLLSAMGATIGAPLVVSVTAAGQAAPERLITAEITALEAEFDSTGSYTVVRGLDPAHRLFRGRRTETYTQVTASDVATKVARRAGLKVGTVESTSTVFDHLCQGGVSDWVFLDTLAREIGHEVAVRDGSFEFRAPRPAADAPATSSAAEEVLLLRQGSDLLRFRAVVTSADQVGTVEVRGWDVAEKKALVGRHTAGTRSAQVDGAAPADLARTFGDPVYVSGDVPYRTQAEVDSAAAALSEQISGAFAEFDGVARGNPKIRAGAAIAIDNVGKPFDGKYVVTTSRHTYDQSAGYATHFAVTGRQDRSLYGLVSGGAGGRAAPAAAGVVLALVTDVQDPMALGRVKVSFPWLADAHVSDWARTVHAGAGDKRGLFTLPEVGDEVLVAFEHGDLRFPYVLGGLYNGHDAPPDGPTPAVDSGSGSVNRRSLVSRKGHRVDLVDADSTSGVSAQTGDGKLTLTLDASGTTITLHSDGTVKIEGTQGITVDAGTGTLSLSGADVSITGKTGVTIDGGAQATLKAGLVRIN